MVDKNVGIILILFGDLLQKLGMQELFVLVVEVLFYVLFYVLSQKEQLMCIFFLHFNVFIERHFSLHIKKIQSYEVVSSRPLSNYCSKVVLVKEWHVHTLLLIMEWWKERIVTLWSNAYLFSQEKLYLYHNKSIHFGVLFTSLKIYRLRLSFLLSLWDIT